MDMSKWTKWTIGALAAVFLGTVGLGLGTAIAMADSQEVAPAADPDPAGWGWHGRGFGLVDMQALLAKELGISVEELQAAQQAAREAAVQQLVDAGVLTEQQGELANAAAALRSYMDRHDLMAEALGMTPEALTEARLDGKTLAEILDDQGLSLSEYQENLSAARDDALGQAVADGVITQEQLDQLQERMPGRMPGGFGPGRGRHPFGGLGLGEG